ncbi:glycosyltransferase [bacterium]|nr:glycosyltransferase [bacterium]NDC94064.1 glycosyltransferase [bacterium]NDD82750.1 glycosyltransferase [bacterium]NDG29170.1 glycosyltransferase [bacterium]
MKVLFKGWTRVPHSYAMVNCFQMVALKRRFKDDIDIYVQEMDYYQEHWNKAQKWVYNADMIKILKSFKEYAGEPVDLVYSITYPYNVTSVPGAKKCVFYTSEFSALDRNYFVLNGNSVMTEGVIKQYLQSHPDIYFTSPSEWSARGMRLLGLPDSRNRTITHGIDPDTFRLLNKPTNVRDFYNIADTDILLMNIGAMTKNKGITLIIETLNELVNRRGLIHYKLLLKGTGDLYETSTFVRSYLQEFVNSGIMTKAELDLLVEEYIIFTDKTLSYEKINELYNAADIYVSPYLAEGFNLTTLEALAAGLPVIVPQSGSTQEYIDAIKANGGGEFVKHVPTQVITFTNTGFRQNVIQSIDLTQTVLDAEKAIYELRKTKAYLYPAMREYITSHYSWDNVAGELMDYFKDICNC